MVTSTENNIAQVASKFINNTDRHVFLTGKAGTGKTTFLKHITQHTYKQSIIVAPTGIAAINAGGVTIHSLFQLPFGAFVPDNSVNAIANNNKINTPSTIFQGYRMHGRKRRLLRELELLIIDEVSMLRADLLDAIDTVLRSVRRQRNVPFGGVQILFIGDLLQLPPVIKDEEWSVLNKYYSSPYFFEAQGLKSNPPVYLELEKIYRQSDSTFINILNNLRNNTVTKEDIETLNQHYKPGFKPPEGEKYIHLTTHNRKADELNKSSLQKLKSKPHFFEAEIIGDFSEYSYPVDFKMELKEGAQVMFIKNDPSGEQRFFNGKIGTISSIDEQIIVEFDDGSESVELERYTWENIKYTLDEGTNEITEEVKGKFIQYPIKLAWAITVHKSQGLTFEKAIIDIGSAFAPGQVYVALSRLTSLDGLVLSSSINYDSLEIDRNIHHYAQTKPDKSALNQIFREASSSYFEKYILKCFDFSEVVFYMNRHLQSYQKDKNRSVKQQYLPWAQALKDELVKHKQVADKFLSQLHTIFKEENYMPKLTDRVEAAKKHFIPVFESLNKTTQDHLKHLESESRVKAYMNEVRELDSVFYKQMQLFYKAEAMIQSVKNDAEFNSETISTDEVDKKRMSEQVVKTKKKKKLKPKKEKGKKVPVGKTKEISYEMYKAGKSIEEIAQERELVTQTIEGHLAHYVGLGLIPLTDFVTEKKAKNIFTVSEKIDSKSLKDIKSHLGDEYTYPEIKCAMEYYVNMRKEK